MRAEQILREGRLLDALTELQEQIRSDPANAKLRIFLFQLLAVLGEWDRAMTQLNVAGDLDAGNLAMVQTYREALRCEVLRAEIFSGKRSPLVFGEPEQWVALVMEALRFGAEDRNAQSQKLRAQKACIISTLPKTSRSRRPSVCSLTAPNRSSRRSAGWRRASSALRPTS